MKKIAAIITVVALAGAMAACANNTAKEVSGSSAGTGTESTSTGTESTGTESTSTESTSTESTSTESTGTEGTSTESSAKLLGSWKINDDETVGWAPDDAKAAFEEAMKGFTGQDFSIVGYLGSQVVAGKNYMFLCKGTLVTKEPVTELKVVTVYQDPEGNARITNVSDFNIGEYWNVDNSDEEQHGMLAGGWYLEADAPAVELPVPVSEAYDQAMSGETGYYPMAYLGEQLVSGKNYCVLCYHMDEETAHPCLVYIYQPLSGDAELTSIYFINQGDFNKAADSSETAAGSDEEDMPISPESLDMNGYLVRLDTDGMGQVARAEEGRTLKFEDDYSVMSTADHLAEGTKLMIAAKPDDGYSFVKWTLNGDDYSTDEQTTYTVTEDADFVAVFE